MTRLAGHARTLTIVLATGAMLVTSNPTPDPAASGDDVGVRAAGAKTSRVRALQEAAKASEQHAQARAAARRAAQHAKAAAHVHGHRTAQKASAPTVASGSVWDALARCESSGRWTLNATFDGGLQFHPDTWSAYAPPGYPAYAYQATREQQIAVAQRVRASQGWGAWPACARKLGLL